ncbi:hypothetical protein SPLC1_S050040 [Arthrospira platensis C1]|nr:hypothetical protein SPLC1_S551160 [Arthrospira platensis C1]EKD10796.1 hypothetical protein SPLC1_S050040 [Arthrospira platensis C1]
MVCGNSDLTLSPQLGATPPPLDFHLSPERPLQNFRLDSLLAKTFSFFVLY